MDFNEREVIEFHLTGNEPEGRPYKSFSSLTAAIRDARQATSRDLVTGEKNPKVPHSSWLGALGYFTVLDQVGTCFRVKGEQPDKLKGVKAALKHFTKLDERSIGALYALRCSFAHDFSLFNVDERRPNLTHRFFVIADSLSSLITFPKKQWCGDPFESGPGVFTLINLEAFGDLVESVYRRLLELHRSDLLDVVLKHGAMELAAKYAYSIVPHN